MKAQLSFTRQILIAGMPIVLLASIFLISKSSIVDFTTKGLALGITIDLLFTIPFVYFLLIRKTKISNLTVIPLLISGMIMGSYILPEEHQQYLVFFKLWIFPIVEISIISFVIYKVRKVINAYKREKKTSIDFYIGLKKACFKLFPKKVVMPIVTEIAVFYYGFILWKKRIARSNEFTYHKKSGTVTLLIAIVFIIGIETYVFHILLLRWNAIAAWIFTSLSVYSGIQIFGFAKSLSKRLISIDENLLILPYGILTETIIDIDEIESVVVSTAEIKFDDDTRKLSPLGELESHNVVINLKTKNTLIGLYGIKKTYTRLALFVDNPNGFKNQIEAKSSVLAD